MLGANVVKDLGATVRNVSGGRVAGYEEELGKARAQALQEMTERAAELGADAVIGVQINYENINRMLMVAATGTAVKLS